MTDHARADDDGMAQGAPSAFSMWSTTIPHLQIAWDATSLSSFITCAQRYKHEIIDGYRRAAGAGSRHVDFGTMYHSSLETFDKALAAGQAHDEAAEAALRHALLVSHEWDSGDDKKNRDTLVRAVVWYCDDQRDGPVRPYVFPNGHPAVELSFRLPLGLRARTGEEYMLCGHLDGLCVVNDDEIMVRERKTTQSTIGTYYFDGFAPNVQVDTYDLVSTILFPELKIKGVLLEATQAAVQFARFHRQPMYRTPAQREEWLQEMLAYIQEAEECAARGHWPLRRTSCNLYGGCPFRSICSKDPAVRERFLRGGDYVEQHWDPLEVR